MAPVVTMRQLLEAGVHFGHQTRRWNPKMQRFIYGERNGIYLIDLQQTLSHIVAAYTFVRDTVANGGQILFVGTKKQAQDSVQSFAERCGQPYVNQRWLGGMLTNFETMSKRVAKMKEYQRMRDSGEFDAMPKKEALLLTRELAKLERNLGGIRNMEKLPDAVFVLDTKKEHIAVTEANKLGLPTIAVVDTNCDPDIITFVIPGNDDAIRSGDLMCRIICEAVEEGRLIAAKRGEARMERSAEEEAEVAARQEQARAAAAAAAASREARVAQSLAGDSADAGEKGAAGEAAARPDQQAAEPAPAEPTAQPDEQAAAAGTAEAQPDEQAAAAGTAEDQPDEQAAVSDAGEATESEAAAGASSEGTAAVGVEAAPTASTSDDAENEPDETTDGARSPEAE